MLSALIISPFIFFAKYIASFDFPEAVGPAKRIIFFDKLINFTPRYLLRLLLLIMVNNKVFSPFFENTIHNII